MTLRGRGCPWAPEGVRSQRGLLCPPASQGGPPCLCRVPAAPQVRALPRGLPAPVAAGAQARGRGPDGGGHQHGAGLAADPRLCGAAGEEGGQGRRGEEGCRAGWQGGGSSVHPALRRPSTGPCGPHRARRRYRAHLLTPHATASRAGREDGLHRGGGRQRRRGAGFDGGCPRERHPSRLHRGCVPAVLRCAQVRRCLATPRTRTP